MVPDLNALAVFAVVAEERNFRAAADRLGVTRSAVSQTVQRLEESLGTALLLRTTRSVSLTEAGEHIHVAIAPAIADMRVALEKTEAIKSKIKSALMYPVAVIVVAFVVVAVIMIFVIPAFKEVSHG